MNTYTKIHVFFDNSNILGGALSMRKLNEPKTHWAAFRLYYRNLFRLIEKNRVVEESVLAGSVPPSCDLLWDYARRAGYSTDLLRRVEKDDGSVGEQGVDEMLHLKMANCLLDNEPSDRVLIVATGDGKKSEFGTGFRDQVERALKRKWLVEVWSWSPTLNGCYGEMCGRFPGLKIHTLDPHYLSVTFIKGGSYYLHQAGKPITQHVEKRVVAPLQQ